MYDFRPGFAILCSALLFAQGAPAVEESAGQSQAQEQQGEGGNKAELVFEADPYYSDIGYTIPLTSKPIPTITAESEAEVYSELIRDSLVPRYMLLEASVYPLPWLFTYLKGDEPDLYARGEIAHSGINVFESATAGFQEPWALSMFFGNVARLKRPDANGKSENWGYTGYLVSGGNKHIKENRLIDDEWYELEWKIKGRRAYADDKLEWSFRGGARFNDNRDVNDVVYIGLHRSNIDFRYSFLEWLENTNYDLRIHSLQEGGSIVRVELIGGKNVPFHAWHLVSTLDVGFVWTSPNEYSGELKDAKRDKLTLVFRPSFAL